MISSFKLSSEKVVEMNLFEIKLKRSTAAEQAGGGKKSEQTTVTSWFVPEVETGSKATTKYENCDVLRGRNHRNGRGTKCHKSPRSFRANKRPR